MERAVAVKHLLAERQRDDPIKEFIPTPKQQAFVDAILDQGKTRVGFFAGNRAGKSDAGAYVGASLARYGPPNPKPIMMGQGDKYIEVKDRATSGWVISRDFQASREVVQPKYFNNGLVSPGSHKQIGRAHV